MNPNVLKDLIKTRNILKRKFESIKQGEAETELILEKTFKPITTPLKKAFEITKHFKNPDEFTFKHEFENMPTSTPFIKKTKLTKTKKDTSVFQSFSDNESMDSIKYDNTVESQHFDENSENYEVNEKEQIGDEENEKEQIEDEENETQQSKDEENEESMQVDDIDTSIPAEHINLYLKDISKLDRIFGPTKEDNNIWYIAKTPITFERNTLTVEDKKYPLTKGLIELLFLKEPFLHKQDDLFVYKKILEKTNVHRCGQTASGRLKSSKSRKYNNIIKPLFSGSPNKSTNKNKSKSIIKGGGANLMQLNLKKSNYVYWDDPNELVDRLRLLVSSTLAGHSNHNNEILSIIEELKEANIII